MRNIFQENSSRGHFGTGSPTLGGFRPLQLGTKETPKELPSRPVKLSHRTNRLQWTVERLCSIMQRFSDQNVDPETQSKVFWSYVRQANGSSLNGSRSSRMGQFGQIASPATSAVPAQGAQVSQDPVIAAYQARCPGLPVPPKPATPDKELVAESPEKAGFHGKTTISHAEAVELNTALVEVLKPLTPEEAASEIGKVECLRDFAAGNFPKIERLQEDLQAFVDVGDTGATFTISKGDVVVAGKAIDCAVALGRGKLIKGALITGGAIGAGALLLFLL